MEDIDLRRVNKCPARDGTGRLISFFIIQDGKQFLEHSARTF